MTLTMVVYKNILIFQGLMSFCKKIMIAIDKSYTTYIIYSEKEEIWKKKIWEGVPEIFTGWRDKVVEEALKHGRNFLERPLQLLE